jgi:hypothetical protein
MQVRIDSRRRTSALPKVTKAIGSGSIAAAAYYGRVRVVAGGVDHVGFPLEGRLMELLRAFLAAQFSTDEQFRRRGATLEAMDRQAALR